MQRILDHPILGPLPEEEKVTIYVDGDRRGREKEMIAATLMATGKPYFRKTVKRHEPRSIFCGFGVVPIGHEVNGILMSAPCNGSRRREVIDSDDFGDWGGNDSNDGNVI